MATRKRKRMFAASAASAAVVGAGAAVVAPAEPASAHEVTISREGAYATVSADHTRIRVCNTPSSQWQWASVQYKARPLGTARVERGACQEVGVEALSLVSLCNEDGVRRFCTSWVRP